MDRKVLLPKTISELLSVLKKNNDATICAGGTYKRQLFENSELIVSVMSIDELKKITKSSSSISYGSCVYIRDVKNYKATPKILKSAISQMFPYYIQQVATLGGNLFVKEDRISLIPLLIDLSTSIEIRKLNKTYFEDLNIIDIEKDEIITQIKLKRDRFNIEHFKILGTYQSVQNVAMSILGNMFDGIISELYINLYFSNLPNISITANQFINKRLPLKNDDITSIIYEILELVNLKKWHNQDSYYNFIEREIKLFLLEL